MYGSKSECFQDMTERMQSLSGQTDRFMREQDDIVAGLNIYGPRVQTRSTRHGNSRLANDLPVSGLREQIFEVGALLDEQGDALRAMLQDVRQRREEADLISQRVQSDLLRRNDVRANQSSTSLLAACNSSARRSKRQQLPAYILEKALDDEGEQRDCAICLEALQVGQEVVYLECFHAFHAACVNRWTETKGAETSCPLCKRLIFPAASSLRSPQNVTAPPPSTLLLTSHSSASRRHSVSATTANAHTHSTQRTPASRPASAQSHRQVLSLLPLLVQKYKY